MLAAPASVSFGLVRPGATRARPPRTSPTPAAAPASWDVAVETVGAATGAAHRRRRRPSPCPAASTSPPRSTAAATEGDLTGFVRLTRGADVRRIPFWLRVGRPGPRRGGGRPRSRRPGCVPATRAASRRSSPATAIPTFPQGGIVTAVAAGARAGVPVHADEARRELRRRHHAARRRACKVEPRIVDGRRREPAHRLRRAPDQPQPVPRAVRRPGARGRCGPPARRQLRHRLRQRHRRRRRRASRSASGSTTPGRRSLTLDAGARAPRTSPLVVRATDAGSGHRRDDDQGHDRRQAVRDDARSAGCVRIPTTGAQAREAPAAAPGLRLPGVAQHGERAADPAQHARAARPRS